MFIAGIVGNTVIYQMIFVYITARVSSDLAPLLLTLLIIFGWIAVGGGISVIIGSIITFKSLATGKWIIGLGAGMGLIGFIVFIATGIYAGTIVGTWSEIIIGLLLGPMSYGIIGVFTTIFARRSMRKGKKEEEE